MASERCRDVPLMTEGGISCKAAVILAGCELAAGDLLRQTVRDRCFPPQIELCPGPSGGERSL
jgi:hypothetical protein